MITMLMLLAIKKHTAVKKRWGINQVFLVKTSKKHFLLSPQFCQKKMLFLSIAIRE